MHITIEYDPYSSMFYVSSPIICSPEKDKSNVIVMPDSAVTAFREEKEMMTHLSIWTCSSMTEMSSSSLSCYTDSILLALSVRDDGVDL